MSLFMKTSLLSGNCVRLMMLPAFCGLLGTSFSRVAEAQVTGGIILGIVTDAQGGALPGVKVAAKNVATGVALTTETNAAGSYEFPVVNFGTYDISATAPGFASYSRPGIELQLQQRQRIDIVMTLASVQQSIEVKEGTPLVNTDSASASHVISTQTVADAPLFGRNPQMVTRLVPGANPTFITDSFASPSATFVPTDVSFNGTPAAGSLILLDGVADQYGTGAMGFTPPTYAVQEVRVQTFALSAEYGQTAGGVVAFETKSGTNSLHGDAWFYHSEEGFNANDFFSNRIGRARTENRRTQPGFTLGGPVYIPHLYNGKNRTFWFFDYDGERDRVGTINVATVPTARQRTGDFSQTFAANGQLIQIYNPFSAHFDANNVLVRDPFLGNVIPDNLINPVAQNLLNKFVPLPNLPGSVNNYSYNYGYPHSDNGFHPRLDHRFNEKNSLSASFGWLNLDLKYPGPLATGVSGYDNQSWSKLFTVGFVHVFSPTMILNIRGGVQAYKQELNPLVAGAAIQGLGFSSTFLSEVHGDIFPSITSSDMTALGYPYQLYSFVNPDVRTSVTKILGRHSVDVGYEFKSARAFLNNATGQAGSFAFNRDFTQGPNASVPSATSGFGIATLLLGTPSSGSINYNANNAIQSLYNAVYVQDNWRATNRLTLNLGLRYDYQTPYTERYNRLNRGLDLTSPNPIAQQAQAAYAKNPIPQLATLNVTGGLVFAGVNGNSRYQFEPERNNFAPRIGGAYQLTDKTVLRAGIGWFYMPFTDARVATVSQLTPPISQAGFSSSTVMQTTLNGLPVNSLTNPFPTGIVLPVGSSLGLSTLLGQGISAADVNSKRGLSRQFQFSLQRQLFGDSLIELAYVGSRVHDITVDHPLNQLSPQYYSLADQLSQQVPNPFFGMISAGPLSGSTVARSQLLLPYPEFTSVTNGYSPIGSSWYNALQVSGSRRFSNGLSMIASYTFSKQIDEMRFRNQYQPIERSIAQIDRPHRFTLNTIWQIPVGKGQAFGSSMPKPLLFILGNWELDPTLTIQSGQLAGPWSNAIAVRPLQSVDQSITHWFDTGAFAPLPSFTLPSLSTYNTHIRGQALRNLDVSLAKNIPIREQMSLRLMLQAYNALNTVQFAPPNVAATSQAFGTVSSQLNNPRFVVIGGVFQF